MNKTQIVVQATIKSNLEKVWQCYTGPEHIIHWNFADDSWCCPSAKNDLRIGGTYVARMEAKDGSAGFDFDATYTEVIKNKKLSFVSNTSKQDAREVHVVFSSVNEGISVEITFDAEKTHSIEMQRSGWQAILNNFKKYVESQ